jgi:hypothetical protein
MKAFRLVPFLVSFGLLLALVPATHVEASSGMQRWTFCMVDSDSPSEAWASPVFRQDFGTGYTGDPEVYARLVNRFLGAVKEQFTINGRSLNTTVCYLPLKDLSRDEVEDQRATDLRRFDKVHRVDFP